MSALTTTTGLPRGRSGYGGQAATYQATEVPSAESTARRSSCSSRLRPLPWGPTRDTQRGLRSRTARQHRLAARRQLAAAADQRAVVPGRRCAGPADGDPPTSIGGGLAGERQPGRERAVFDQAGGGPAGGRADHDGAGRRVLLEAGRGGDHRAAGHAVRRRRGRAARSTTDLAGGDADPDPQRTPAGHRPPVQRGLDLQPGPHRPVRVEAVGVPGPEQRHHRVADVLLHHAPPAAQHPGDGVEVGALQGPDVLRVEPLDQRGRADDVGEQHGDCPSLLGHRPAAVTLPTSAATIVDIGIAPPFPRVACLTTSGDCHRGFDGGSAERRMSATRNL